MKWFYVAIFWLIALLSCTLGSALGYLSVTQR